MALLFPIVVAYKLELVSCGFYLRNGSLENQICADFENVDWPLFKHCENMGLVSQLIKGQPSYREPSKGCVGLVW